MGQQWLGWELALELVLEPLPAWSAVEGASQAAFKCCGALRQWLPHSFGLVFFFLPVIIWVFFFFERLYQKLIQMCLH